jgi:cytochrome P450
MTTTASLVNDLNEYFGAGTGDPYPILAEKRRQTPVMEGDIAIELGAPSPAALHEGPVFSFLRYDDVRDTFRDAETFSSAIWNEAQEPFLGRTVLGMDGEEHRFWRGLLTPVFTPRALKGWEEDVLQPTARRLVEEMAPANRADLVDYAFRFPIRAIHGVLGLDEESSDEFAQLTLEMLFLVAIDPANPELTQRNLGRAMQACQTTLQRLVPLVERKRATGAPGNDLISHLINAEFEGRTLDDEEIAVFVRSILLPATESTTRMFLNIMVTLLRRPELLDRIREDRSLLMPAILEGERHEPVALGLPRLATRDVEIRGVTIPKGAGVMLCVSSANRDEEAFPDPDEFVIEREGPPALTFGFGRHMCIGMATSRREIAAMMGTVFDSLPGLRLDPDVPPPELRGVTMRSPSALHVVWD